MTLRLLIGRSLAQHALSTVVTALSLALACGLLLSIWRVRAQSQAAFTQVNGGFDAVLGARSTKLQLVLNAVFHLESSPANVRWTEYQEIQTNAMVALAVPIAMGDSYRGFQVVGTLPEMFTAVEFVPGKLHQVLIPGRLFEVTLREAVVGSFVARQLGLRLGDRFHPYHGLDAGSQMAHADEYIVVGILKPSNTPADRVIWIPLEGLQRMSGHATETVDDVSAVLLKLRSPLAGRFLEQRYNRDGSRLTLAWPIGATMATLLERLGWFDRVLALVAYLVTAVAAGSVLASIYNSMNERRRQMAILRALGARRMTLLTSIVLEAATIGALGAGLGLLVHAGIFVIISRVIQAKTGVVFDLFAWHPVLVWAPLGMIGASALAGILPAWKAYRTEVAQHLAP